MNDQTRPPHPETGSPPPPDGGADPQAAAAGQRLMRRDHRRAARELAARRQQRVHEARRNLARTGMAAGGHPAPAALGGIALSWAAEKPAGVRPRRPARSDRRMPFQRLVRELRCALLAGGCLLAGLMIGRHA